MIRLSLFSLCAALGVTLTFGAMACAKKTDVGFEDTDDGGVTAGDSGTFGGDAVTIDPQAGCSSDNKDPYVIGDDRTLYVFNPPTVTFMSKGIIDCPTGGATPTSMAVDRSGTAWVRHSDGSVWKVSTETLQCEATAYASQTDMFQKFGMGFATSAKGGVAETLFLSDSTGAGLASLDTSTLELNYIGPYTGSFKGTTSELTGTGDGKLYGFFTTTPTQIAEISQTTGDVVPGSAHMLANVFAGDAWAFSFYAGDFYVYTAETGGSDLPMNQTGSSVTKYSPADGSVTVLKKAIGFTIVGAGVSTCAPTAAVK